MHSKSAFALALGILIQASRAAETSYYSQPALFGDRIVFVSEGDLWTANVPEDQSNAPIIAYRLTSSEGAESRPCFSPDGQWIAFSAQYEGNTDVYIMPIDGGAPKRLTFHPGPDIALAWTSDGQSVLFSSNRSQQFGRPELYRVSITGGMPTRYEFGECSMISLSSTGRRAAFTRWSNENWNWKRYRGGTAPEIWLGDFNTNQFAPLTRNTANDLFPMWVQERVYFISDRSGAFNIVSASADMTAPEKDLKQHTKFAGDPNNPTAIEGYDVRWPSADAKRRGTKIVFCQAGALALFDSANDSIRRLDVRLASDRIAARQRFAPLGETITEFTLSHDGKSVIVGSRGEIMSLPVEVGVAQQITRTSNAREWGAEPLGEDRLVMISDATGEQQIAVAPADGSAMPSLVTTDRESWLFPPKASPDGKWIAFADKTLRLHVLNTASLQRQQVDQSEAGEITDYRFSPDSQWLAYTKPMLNGRGSVNIYSLRTGRPFQISSVMNDDSNPRWDPAGKYLYYFSKRNINPVLGDFDLEHVLINTTEMYCVPLAVATPPPFKDAAHAVDFDLDKWASPPEDEGKDKQKGDKAKAEKKEGEEAAAPPAEPEAKPIDPNAPPPNAIRIDTDGIGSREFRLAIEPGNYSDLEALWGAITYVATPVPGLLDDSWPDPPAPEGVLHRFDIVKAEDKSIAEKIAGYVVSAKADLLAYPVVDEEGHVASFKVVPSAGEGDAKEVDVKSQKLHVNMLEEWKQILAEAWRLQRDFYWAPNYVGQNWPAMKTKYEALLPRIGTRGELNDLIGQLIGELGTSHTYVWGGDEPRHVKPVQVGMLGADITFDGQGFRIARIVPGQAWGEDELVSPLEAAYLNVKVGNYITAINGVQPTPAMDCYELLQNQADKMVRLTIADDASGTNSRTIEVKTLSDEQPLRYAAWVEANRKYVEEKSNGVLGYLHIPDMGGPGLSMFSRLFYPQFNKHGLVIDIRDNGGGFVSQMIIERLSRRPIAYDQPRHGLTERYPMRAVHAHMAAIIDQHAGSDGDIFPATFRMVGLGPLIGTRTWGGVVGIRGDKPFVDMGLSTQPEFAWWDTTGGWTIENEGVKPDIEIDITPEDRIANRDPQLDKAIEVLLQKLKDQPMDSPKPPPWPVRVGGANP